MAGRWAERGRHTLLRIGAECIAGSAAKAPRPTLDTAERVLDCTASEDIRAQIAAAALTGARSASRTPRARRRADKENGNGKVHGRDTGGHELRRGGRGLRLRDGGPVADRRRDR